MKFLLTITAALIFTISGSYAQEQTLLGRGEISHGGFGGPVIKYVQVKGEPGILVGGRGGWIINHSFVLGGGGYGLVNDIKADEIRTNFIDPFYDRYINFGYGGVELEYIVQSDQLVHLSVYTLIGAGAVSYRDRNWNDFGDWNSPTDAFFVFEPAVNAELNIISFMRISAGLSYRFISGATLDSISNSDLDGPSAVLTFKFGKF